MSSPYATATTSPRLFPPPNMAPSWSKKSFLVPTAPVDKTNVSMTTMPRMAMTARPNLLRILNASKGLKAIAVPRFTTAILGGGSPAGLDAPRRRLLFEGDANVTRRTDCSDAGGQDNANRRAGYGAC